MTTALVRVLRPPLACLDVSVSVRLSQLTPCVSTTPLLAARRPLQKPAAQPERGSGTGQRWRDDVVRRGRLLRVGPTCRRPHSPRAGHPHPSGAGPARRAAPQQPASLPRPRGTQRRRWPAERTAEQGPRPVCAPPEGPAGARGGGGRGAGVCDAQPHAAAGVLVRRHTARWLTDTSHTSLSRRRRRLRPARARQSLQSTCSARCCSVTGVTGGRGVRAPCASSRKRTRVSAQPTR